MGVLLICWIPRSPAQPHRRLLGQFYQRLDIRLLLFVPAFDRRNTGSVDELDSPCPRELRYSSTTDDLNHAVDLFNCVEEA